MNTIDYYGPNISQIRPKLMNSYSDDDFVYLFALIEMHGSPYVCIQFCALINMLYFAPVS